MHLGDEVEVVADGSGFKGKKRKAKGFYNKQTGKTTFLAENNLDLQEEISVATADEENL